MRKIIIILIISMFSACGPTDATQEEMTEDYIKMFEELSANEQTAVCIGGREFCKPFFVKQISFVIDEPNGNHADVLYRIGNKLTILEDIEIPWNIEFESAPGEMLYLSVEVYGDKFSSAIYENGKEKTSVHINNLLEQINLDIALSGITTY